MITKLIPKSAFNKLSRKNIMGLIYIKNMDFCLITSSLQSHDVNLIPRTIIFKMDNESLPSYKEETNEETKIVNRRRVIILLSLMLVLILMMFFLFATINFITSSNSYTSNNSNNSSVLSNSKENNQSFYDP